MNNRREENPDGEFADRLGAVLNARADALDGATRSRLNRARQSALAARTGNDVSADRRWNWAPAGSAALVALFVAVVLVDGYRLGGSAVETGSVPINAPVIPAPTAADFEMLMVDEDLEMLHDLDFYNWLQSVPGRSAAGVRGEGLG